MKNAKKINAKLAIFVAGFAVFLATFNETFLNVAFNGIGASLGVETSLVQWLATAYMLGASVMVPVSAFLYRKIPTKRLFAITVSLLIVGSLIGGFADNFAVLLVGRVIQSLGSGMLVPICMNIALAVAPKSKLGFYMGLMGAMTTLGPSLSIIISGLLLSVAEWHVLLWTFGGLSCVLLVFALCFLGNVAELSKPKLDVVSVVLISIALIGVLFGISTILSGSVAYACVALVVGIACLVLFVVRQNKIPEPLIDLTPLKVPQFAIGVCLNMLALCIVFAMNILLPMYLQDCLGASEFNSSIALFPAIFLCCIMSPIAGKIYDRFGVKVILPLGFVLMCLFGLGIGLIGGDNTVLSVALMYVPVILGSALIIGPAQTFALSHLRRENNGAGVTILSTGFQIAGCIGSSVFVNLYAMMLGERGAGGSVANLSACNHSLLVCMVVIACVGFLGAVLAFVVGRLKRKGVANVNDCADVANAGNGINGNINGVNCNNSNNNENIPISSTAMGNRDGACAGGDTLAGVGASSAGANGGAVVGAGGCACCGANAGATIFGGASGVGVESVASGADSDKSVPNARNIRICDLMNTDVFAVGADDSILKAMQLMAEKSVGGLPVVDKGGRFVGFISDGDIVRYLSNTYPLFLNAYSFATMCQNDNIDEKLGELVGLSVREIASTRTIAVKLVDDLSRVCRVLSENIIKKVPVLDDNGKMVGIINSSSITKYAIKVCLQNINNGN